MGRKSNIDGLISQRASRRGLIHIDALYEPIPVFEADWHGYQVDAYYPAHKLIIELDGYHDHSLPDRFEADRERDELAITLQHATLRITWQRLTGKPGELDHNLRTILAARAPAARLSPAS